jgi:exopolyphosphatase/pppGpp-phosphohydrolase
LRGRRQVLDDLPAVDVGKACVCEGQSVRQIVLNDVESLRATRLHPIGLVLDADHAHASTSNQIQQQPVAGAQLEERRC